MIFGDKMGNKAVELLEKELVKLTVKSAKIVPSKKPTLFWMWSNWPFSKRVLGVKR